MDLFGDNITQPTMTQSLQKSLINRAYGFAEWWKAWPGGPRKVAKQQCLDKWARFECAETASHILAHTEWLKTQDCWLKDNGAFICAPLTYLNQQRWSDWTPEPERPKKLDILAELKAHKGSKAPDYIRHQLNQLKARL